MSSMMDDDGGGDSKNDMMYDDHHPSQLHPPPLSFSTSSSSPSPRSLASPRSNHLPLPRPSPPQPLSPTSSSSSSSSSATSLDARVNSFRAACLDVLIGHQTHHLIPHSSKVIIFDSKLKVQHAFDGLVTHDITCAPVWDSTRRKYVGLLSVSDFLDILLATAGDVDRTAFLSLSTQRLCDWAEFKRRRGTSINRLLCISPESTLHEAVRQLLNYRVHRLCVVQLALADTILRILSNHGILRFLRQSCPQFASVTIRELGIGVFDNLVTLTPSTPISRAMEMLSQYRVSSIPVVDASHRPIDVYSRSDIRYLAADANWTNLDLTIEAALAPHQHSRTLPLCTRDDTLMTVSGLLVACNKHSLICTHPHTGVVEGVVSLTDIFSFILDSGPPRAEGRMQQLREDLDRGGEPGGVFVVEGGGAGMGVVAGPRTMLRGTTNGSPGAEDDSEMGDAADIAPDEDFLR